MLRFSGTGILQRVLGTVRDITYTDNQHRCPKLLEIGVVFVTNMPSHVHLGVAQANQPLALFAASHTRLQHPLLYTPSSIEDNL